MHCLVLVRSPPTQAVRLLHAPVQASASVRVRAATVAPAPCVPLCLCLSLRLCLLRLPPYSRFNTLLVALRPRKLLFNVSVLAWFVFLFFRCVIHQGVALKVSSAPFLLLNVVLPLPPPGPSASLPSTHHARLLRPISVEGDAKWSQV